MTSPDSSTTPSCPVCDWPMDAANMGCVPGNCSYRPQQGSEYARIQQRRKTLADSEQGPTTPPAQGVASYQELLERLRAAPQLARLDPGRGDVKRLDEYRVTVSNDERELLIALLSRTRPLAGAEGEENVERLARVFFDVVKKSDDFANGRAELSWDDPREKVEQGRAIVRAGIRAVLAALPSAEQAREEERERAAQIVEKWPDTTDCMETTPAMLMRKAAAIRQRKSS